MAKNITVSIILCEAIGLFGAYFTTPAITSWYVYLTKPWFTPPSWIFGPVWTFLYMLMGISLGRIWSLGIIKPAVRSAVVLFLVQLVFNFFWSLVFFGLRNPAAALIIIFVLWLFIAASIIAFRKLDRLAGNLLVPYLAWVSFASLLNASIWLLNR